MSALILKGAPLAAKICAEFEPRIERFRKDRNIAPTLAVVRVGNSPAAVRYAHALDRAFTKCDMGFQLDVLGEATTTAQLIERLDELAHAKDAHGILLQRPLPATIDAHAVMRAFPIGKDVEGVTPLNLGNLALNTDNFFPTTTPNAVIEILRYYEIPVQGKHIVIVGRSNILGKPLALLLLNANATVTVCHSQTPDLATFTRQADILIVGMGQPQSITAAMIAPGAVVVDCGVTMHGEQLIGDVDFEAVKDIASAITPVPGGTGLVTTRLLMQNTVRAAEYAEQEIESRGRIKWLPILKSPRRRK